MFGYSTTAGSVFDYKNGVRTLAEKFASPEMADKRGWLNDFLYIEASKDLIRFRKHPRRKKNGHSRAAALSVRTSITVVCSTPRRAILSAAKQEIYPNCSAWKKRPSEGQTETVLGQEKRLLNERARLESTGELNIWQR